MNRFASASILVLCLSVAARAAEGPDASELPVAPAAPSSDACARLTPAAFAESEAALGALAAAAEQALGAHGTGAYPGAMKRALDQITTAREKIASLQSWLTSSGMLGAHVTNTTAAYNVAGYAREAIGALDTGRHWASVATAYDRSAIGKGLVGDSAKAHDRLADLETDGLLCYVSAYVP